MSEEFKPVLISDSKRATVLHVSPEEAVDLAREKLRDARDRGEPFNKAVVILLRDRDGDYSHNLTNAGMRYSELIALLHVVIDRCLAGIRGANRIKED